MCPVGGMFATLEVAYLDHSGSEDLTQGAIRSWMNIQILEQDFNHKRGIRAVI